MCIPFLIPDPPPKKLPRKSGLIVWSDLPNSPKIRPTFIEISPQLTYVASPKPDRCRLPPQGRQSPKKSPQTPCTEFLDGFVAGVQASSQEEGRVLKDNAKAQAKPNPAPPPQPTEKQLEKAPPPIEKPTPPQPAHDLPAEPKPLQQPPPPILHDSHNPHNSPSQTPHCTKSSRHHSPYIYKTRPPPPHRSRSRSRSCDSRISRRSFERLRRNLHVVLERVRVLEAEKEAWEARERCGREARAGGRYERGPEVRVRCGKGVEAGRSEGKGAEAGRREGSLIRERRERGVGRGREGERRDWEGGGWGGGDVLWRGCI